MSNPKLRLAVTVALLATGCATASTSDRRLFSALNVLDPDVQPFPDVPTQTFATGQELKEPPAYKDTNPNPNIYEFDVTAGQGALPILNGPKTQMFLYNGQFPGPTIRCKEGTIVKAHFHNRLPLPANIHFHGMIIPPEQDGAPQNLVSPGQDHTYTWVAHKDFPMNTWYHAHPHGITHVEVPRGLSGFTQILATKDPLPAAYGNSQITLLDQRFDANNQFTPDTEFDRINGREGNIVFVNGQILPKLTLKPGEIRRLTILNGSPARFYDVAIPGVEVLWVGTDGGLFEKPIPITHQLVTNSERIQILIKAPPVPNQSYTMVALPFDRGLLPKHDVAVPLMTVRTSAAPVVKPPPVPALLRHIDPIPQTGLRRTIDMRFGTFDTIKHFNINDKRFDPLRIDNVANHDQTEVWTLTSKNGPWWHPMHLHSTQFQVIEQNNVPTPFPAWKDTVPISSSGQVRFVVRYIGFPGLFFFHCHILAHEDDGMMTTLYVNNRTDGPRLGDNLTRLPTESSPELVRWATRLQADRPVPIAEACGEDVDRIKVRDPFGVSSQSVDQALRWMAAGRVIPVQLADR
ncbi:MAG: multicopper oxidase type 3 [Cyanobacteria bacterium RYN_339]|nr:multicopper oxidase type 3 [Cyanobacteria bacterium RYN_339]